MKPLMEELEGVFESLLEYYRVLVRLETKLGSIAGERDGVEGYLEVTRWRLSIARLLRELRALLSTLKGNGSLTARSEACIVSDISWKLLSSKPDLSISLYATPLIAEIYELSRSLCSQL